MSGARVYPYGRGRNDPDNMNPPSTFFAKRAGLRWEVWSEYEGGAADFGGVTERCALWGVRFWFSLTALRVAADMQAAYNEGRYTAMVDADLRACTCHPEDDPPRPCPRQFALSDCRAAARQATRSAQGENPAARDGAAEAAGDER